MEIRLQRTNLERTAMDASNQEKWIDTAQQDTLSEIAADWTWRWEFQDKWQGVVFNAGTDENPIWVCTR